MPEQKVDNAGASPETGEARREPKKELASIVRIVQTDIPGHKNILTGLTYIKGISWSISNAICKILKIDNQRKISDLKEDEINRITEFLKNPELPNYLKNRRNDFESGKDSHLISTDLDMKKEFDIRRLKKILNKEYAIDSLDLWLVFLQKN